MHIQANREETVDPLTYVGFSDEHQAYPIGLLSDSWKMNLALACAVLMANTLLADDFT